MKKIRKKRKYSHNCVCKKCGHLWDPIKTEHLNFTCCPICYSSDIKQG